MNDNSKDTNERRPRQPLTLSDLSSEVAKAGHLTMGDWADLFGGTAMEEDLIRMDAHFNECQLCKFLLADAEAYEEEAMGEDDVPTVHQPDQKVMHFNTLRFNTVRRGRATHSRHPDTGQQTHMVLFHGLAAQQQSEKGWEVVAAMDDPEGGPPLRVLIEPMYFSLTATLLAASDAKREADIVLELAALPVHLVAGKPTALGELEELHLTDQSSDREIKDALTRLGFRVVQE